MNLLDLRASDRAEFLDVVAELTRDATAAALAAAEAVVRKRFGDLRERVAGARPPDVAEDLWTAAVDAVPAEVYLGVEDLEDAPDPWALAAEVLAGLADRGWTVVPRARTPLIPGRAYPRVKRLRR